MIAFLVPILNEKFKYATNKIEVESVVKNIAEEESQNYAINSQYLSIKRDEQSLLAKKFKKITSGDLKYYNYIITTEMNSFKILVEPKSKFLKTRDIFPQIYTYTHILQGKSSGHWSHY